MVNVIVTMMVKPGRMGEFLGLCARLRPLVLAEKGCLRYEYVRELEGVLPGIQEPADPDRVILVELWESLEALRVHGGAPHMKEFGPLMRELRASVTARVGETAF